MNEREALLEVERLAREIVSGLEVQLVGECDGRLHQIFPCDGEQTVIHRCAKCGEKAEIEVGCTNEIDIDEYCGNSVQLEAEGETKERMRTLSLALVQLDLVRNR